MLTTTIPATLVASIDASGKEAELIKVLTSDDHSYEDKHNACRLLARMGSKACIPALTEMLPDEKYNHIARYALEPIPDPAVEEALRSALPKASGRALAGIALSLGIRKDAKAVSALSELLKHSDEAVVQHAARALGAIGTAGATNALLAVVDSSKGDNHLAVCEGLLRCADSHIAHGNAATARGVYTKLKALPEAPHQLTTAINEGMKHL